MDVLRVHDRIKIDWCNLHRELPDKSGFYGYIQDPTDPNPKWERQGLGFHPGTRSLGNLIYLMRIFHDKIYMNIHAICI